MAAKKVIKEMMPVKKWLSQPEAEAFMDTSKNIFMVVVVKNKLSVRFIVAKKYYNVDQLNKLIEESEGLN